ncbi:MAG: hypothetical protein IT318_19545, partial [Anaerolineales bacterium]|nr:hypothetical protein [Anaerolineales bacterium]
MIARRPRQPHETPPAQTGLKLHQGSETGGLACGGVLAGAARAGAPARWGMAGDMRRRLVVWSGAAAAGAAALAAWYAVRAVGAARPADPGCGGYTYCYTYDEIAGGNQGWGRRTKMEGPLGAGNATTWSYDGRGRVVAETRTVVGVGGAFKTEWQYDALDRLVWMRY